MENVSRNILKFVICFHFQEHFDDYVTLHNLMLLTYIVTLYHIIQRNCILGMWYLFHKNIIILLGITRCIIIML